MALWVEDHSVLEETTSISLLNEGPARGKNIIDIPYPTPKSPPFLVAPCCASLPRSLG